MNPKKPKRPWLRGGSTCAGSCAVLGAPTAPAPMLGCPELPSLAGNPDGSRGTAANLGSFERGRRSWMMNIVFLLTTSE